MQSYPGWQRPGARTTEGEVGFPVPMIGIREAVVCLR